MKKIIKLLIYFASAFIGILGWILSGSPVLGIIIFIALISPKMMRLYEQHSDDNPKGVWFKKRLYGLGWIPVKWQGLLVVVLYAAGIAYFFEKSDKVSNSVNETLINFAIPFIVLTTILAIVCRIKGSSK